ncbi:MAG: LUD domain-containing protein [Candidatus Roizmanbacteria bacterium]
MINTYNTLATDESIEKTVSALKQNGIDVIVALNGAETKEKVLGLIPQGSDVMAMTSVTLDSIGLSDELNRSDGKYKPTRAKLAVMDKNTQEIEMNQLGAAPEYVVGSVHAVTQEGEVLIASNTGSQLPAYAYSALHVIWVVGAQKLVKTLDDGMKRLYEHSLPLESERAKKAYGVAGSAINKILIVKKENKVGRITMVIVKENLGF